ncbi:hypothetical protein F9B82_06590 [Lacticaseibacillus casei]|uniref:Uncharacterized protein n=1 Tax=Lacticaseibacillus casei TaxID=1582 RepID=A0AAN1EXN4_LACCA|nr:hypothetical protein BGL52_00075 [Lacticaseibacillus casei]KAB1970022.1 hypothetical protein F9B82_06590 [Lacticaseibacillus casei]
MFRRLFFWLICGLLNVVIRMLLGDTFGQAMLNILTIIPLIWFVVSVAEITVNLFGRKDHL